MKIRSKLFSIFLVTTSLLILLNLVVIYKSSKIERYLNALEDIKEELYLSVQTRELLHKYLSESLEYILNGSESDLSEYFQYRSATENIMKNRDLLKNAKTNGLMTIVKGRYFDLTNKIQKGIDIAESKGRETGLNYFKKEVVPEFQTTEFEAMNRVIASHFIEIEYAFDNLFAETGMVSWKQDKGSDIRKTRESFKYFSKLISVKYQINDYIEKIFLDFINNDSLTLINLNEITYGLKRTLKEWQNSETYGKESIDYQGNKPGYYDSEIENAIKNIEEKMNVAFYEILSGDKIKGKKNLQRSIDFKIDFIFYTIIDRAIEQTKDTILEDQNNLRRKVTTLRIWLTVSSISISFAIIFILFFVTRGINRSLLRIVKESEKIRKSNPEYLKVSERIDELEETESLLKQMNSYYVNADESRKYFEDLVMRMYPTMVILSRECRIIRANKAFCYLLEYKEDEIAGSTIQVLFPEKYLKNITTLNDFFLKGETVSDERVYLSKKGKSVPILFSASVFRNLSSEITHGLFIAQPLIKQKEKKEIHAGHRERNLFCPSESFPFVYPLMLSLAHELKTPLMNTLGYINFLLLSGEIDLKQGTKDTLKTISIENQKGIQTIEALYGLAHIYLPDKEMVYINSLIKDLLEEESLEDILKNVNINSDFEKSDPSVAGDKNLLSLIFFNILKKIKNEMIKFNCEESGSLSILTMLKDEWIKIIFTFDGEEDAADIVREGNGVRLIALKDGEIDELGIELFVSLGIIKEYGGQFTSENVSLESQRDSAKKESRFTIELPLYAKSHISEYSEENSQSAFSLRGIKVLIADDEKTIRDWLKKLIEAHGGAAVIAEDGLKAMNILKEESFDIIISDVKMPEMDGYELGTWLKINNPDIMSRFILITGLIDNSLDNFSVEWKCHYLIKPFRGEELLSLIQKILEKKG